MILHAGCAERGAPQRLVALPISGGANDLIVRPSVRDAVGFPFRERFCRNSQSQ